MTRFSAPTGLVEPPQFGVGKAEVAQGPPFAEPIAGLLADRQRALIPGAGVLEPSHLLVGTAEIIEGPPIKLPV